MNSKGLVCSFVATLLCSPALAVEVFRVTEANYDKVVPHGKEVDAIIGDWVVRNGEIVAVIAQTTPGRKANMTTRGVAGTLIDLTERRAESDQLSCFYPAGGGYIFEGEPVQVSVDGRPLDGEGGKGKVVELAVSGKSIDGTSAAAKLVYKLEEQSDALDFSVEVTNLTEKEHTTGAECALRCDGNLFKNRLSDDKSAFLAEDQYFRQCYAISLTENLTSGGGRTIPIRAPNTATKIKPGESFSYSGKIFCSQGLPGARSWIASLADASKRLPVQLKLQSPRGSVEHVQVALVHRRADGVARDLGIVESDSKGRVFCKLLPGKYTAKITSIGRSPREHSFQVADRKISDNITLEAPAQARIAIKDAAGQGIPAKIQFLGQAGSETPDFGPDSAIYAVKNAVYTANGKVLQDIAPGTYQVIVSHGPEYTAEFAELLVQAGKIADLNVTLRRVVDSRGWVSTEYHSHSSPSGDNVSHQTGRVLNLLAEHLEFAPCTEHNRVDTYADDLAYLGATKLMATCTGMELTGSPLPINHQNAFPIHHHPHTQDGGGPLTDTDPVKQIERLALWDNASDKVVQTNHPNLPQILGDKDLDGKADGGFRGMLGWMDVIEVHPPQLIFQTPAANISPGDKNDNRMFFWMQLLNLGYRIPGVVNTDAHYNFHGSGWLRNYVRSSSDVPTEISVAEMIQSTEHGNLVMTTAPFMEAFVTDNEGGYYIPGDDVPAGKAKKLTIRVQCANWYDINKVQVFANGRALPEMLFTRKTTPQLFSNNTVRFEANIELPEFAEDTHIIVAAIGEGLTLGPVMGPEQGKLPPIAVANPIFLDIDGGGFQANGDDLGVKALVGE